MPSNLPENKAAGDTAKLAGEPSGSRTQAASVEQNAKAMALVEAPDDAELTTLRRHVGTLERDLQEARDEVSIERSR